MLANMHEAKTNLSRLVERASDGEEIVIGRAGTPVARLVPYDERRPARRIGAWKGRVRIAPDFDELPADIAAAFGMEEE